jgi:hypothetical protein
MYPLRRFSGRMAVAAGILLLFSCDSPNEPEVAAALQLVQGDDQVAQVGSPLARTLEVRVTGGSGRPLAGVTVEYEVLEGGGTFANPVAQTDARGIAAAGWTMGRSAGTQRAAAAVRGQPLAPILFSARAVAASAASLEAAAGDAQHGTVGQPLGAPLVLAVRDAYGNAVSGAAVSWTTGHGSVDPSSGHTDADGLIRAHWTLGTAAATQVVAVARTATDSLVFTARALAGPAASLAAAAGDAQRGTVGQPLAAPLVLAVRDAFGNAVSGAAVTWATGHGSIEPYSAHTDADGLVRAHWTLGTAAAPRVVAVARTATDSLVFTAEAWPETYSVAVTPSQVIALHRAYVDAVAVITDEHGNTFDGEVSWSTSNPAVVTVQAQTPGASRATITTQGTGTAEVRVTTAGAATATVAVQVPASVHESYVTVHTGLTRADALNDLGEIAFAATLGPNQHGVGLWRPSGQIVWPVGRFGVVALSNQGAILLWEHSSFTTSSYVMRDGVRTYLPPVLTYGRQYSVWGVDFNRHGMAAVYSYAVPLRSEMLSGEPVDTRHKSYLWHNGTAYYLPERGSTQAVALDDARNVLVDHQSALGGPWSAWIWNSSQYLAIPQPRPECVSWFGADLNNLGWAAVHCTGGTRNPAAGGVILSAHLWDGAAHVNLAPIVQVSGINDRGEVLGTGAGGVYVWRNGQALLLLDAATAVQGELAINHEGQIMLTTTQWGAFLLSPAAP